MTYDTHDLLYMHLNIHQIYIQKNSTTIQFQQNFSKPGLKFYPVLIPLKFYPREWVDIGVT
jgi:hypothetical protein